MNNNRIEPHPYTPMRALQICALVVASSLAWSCGSGLFGAGVAASGDENTADVAPAVSGRMPEPGSVDQSPATSLLLVFSKPLAVGYDPSNLLSLSYGGRPVSGVATVSGSQIEFQPDRPLALERRHDVQWLGRVSFASGQTLDVNEAWEFAVRPGSWTAANPVITFSTVLDSVVNRTGRAAAISSGGFGLGGNNLSSLFTSVQNEDGTWVAPQPLAFENNSISGPRLAWSQDGRQLYSLWRETVPSSSDRVIRTAKLDTEGSGLWEPLPNVGIPSASTSGAQFAVTRDGTVHCLLRQGQNTLVSQLGTDEVWTTPVVLASTFLYSVEYTPEGDPVAYGFDLTSSDNILRYSRANADGTWGAVTDIVLPDLSLNFAFTFPPKLVFDQDGGALLIFRAGNDQGTIAGTGTLYVEPTGAVGPVYFLDEGLFANVEFAYCDAAYAGFGLFIIAFVSRDGSSLSPETVYSVSWRPGAGGAPSARLPITDQSVVGPSGYFQVQVRAREDFGAMVTWLRGGGNSGGGSLESRRLNTQGIWEELDVISDGIYGCPSFPGPAPITDRGGATILWTELSSCAFGSGKGGPTLSALYGLSARYE